MTKQQAIVWLQKAIERDYCLIELPYNLVAGVIELLAKVPEWVSVKDRPPKESGDYIAYMNGDVTLCHYNPPGENLVPGWSTCDAEGFYYLDDGVVTHWMQKPEPPEEE